MWLAVGWSHQCFPACLAVVSTAMSLLGKSPVQIDMAAGKLGMTRLPQPVKKGHSNRHSYSSLG